MSDLTDIDVLHICGECADCIHDGHRCCGCYDGACCRDANRTMTVLLSLLDVAHIYHVPAGTLRRWLSEGKLTRHGAKPYRIDLAEVEALLERRATLPNRASEHSI